MKKSLFLLLNLLILSTTGFTQPVKKVLLEEYTGTWVGWDPRGFALRDSLVNANPNTVIPVCMHYADPMETTESAAYTNQFNFSGFPSAMIDRKRFAGQSDKPVGTELWAGSVTTRLSQTPSLDIKLTSTFDAQTRFSAVTAKIRFYAAKSGTMKVHLYYLEDSVSSVLAAYDQLNYYGQGCSSPDPNHPYYNYPCSINGFHHRHVFRHAASPLYGTGGIIPGNVAAGDSFSVNYSYVVPAGFNENRMSLVAFVSTTDSSILNAERIPMYTCNCNMTATAQITNISGPGCINGKIKTVISGTVAGYPRFELYDSGSNLISFFNAPPGTVQYTFTNLSSGTYTVKVKDASGCCVVVLSDRHVKCPAPGGGFVTNSITSVSAKVNWNAVTCASGYQVQYRVLGASAWITKSATGANRTLNNLSPSTTFEWKVSTKCSGSNPAVYSAFSAKHNFTTAPLRQGDPVVTEPIAEEIQQATVIPNPATDKITVGFECNSTHAGIRVCNQNGQLVYQQSLESEEGVYTGTIDISGWPAGLYCVMMNGNRDVLIRRFVKQ